MKLLLLCITLLVNVSFERIVSVPELVCSLVVVSLHIVFLFLEFLQLDVKCLDLFVQLRYLLFELVLVQLCLLSLTHSILHELCHVLDDAVILLFRGDVHVLVFTSVLLHSVLLQLPDPCLQLLVLALLLA